MQLRPSTAPRLRPPVTLAVGSSTVTVQVTAQDGTTQSYTVAVTRAASSDATLSALTLSQGSLSPSFASGTLAYTALVSNSGELSHSDPPPPMTPMQLRPSTAPHLRPLSPLSVGSQHGHRSGHRARRHHPKLYGSSDPRGFLRCDTLGLDAEPGQFEPKLCERHAGLYVLSAQ